MSDGNTISEKTKLSLGFLVTVFGMIGAVFAFVLALNTRVATVEAGQKNHDDLDNRRVEAIEKKQDKYTDTVMSIDSRLSRIEGMLSGGKP